MKPIFIVSFKCNLLLLTSVVKSKQKVRKEKFIFVKKSPTLYNNVATICY